MLILFTEPSSVIRVKSKIWPLFLPFAGCPKRCIFCAQEVQTGIKSSISLQKLLEKTWQEFCDLQQSLETPRVFELAFYGGTFTCLPKDDQEACMALVAKLRHKGWIHSVRCSTRPDSCNKSQLAYLMDHEINHIELGIQSFNDQALQAAKREYTGAIAKDACESVLKAGFTLGIQLLPGMPGVDPACFLQDVATALSFSPQGLRFYPCLVIKDTPLATLWHEGLYSPWSEKVTINTLAIGLIASWQAGVPVIRLSLAPEASLESSVLAGPRHPALGSIIKAEALILQGEKAVEKHHACATRLILPDYCKGFWKGHAKNLTQRWKNIGIVSADWHEKPYAILEFSQSK